MKHTEEHYRLFFGRNSDYYLEIVKKQNSNKNMPFSTVAFIFGLFWMLYRKLFRLLPFVFLLLLIEAVIEQTIYELTNTTDTVESIVDKTSWLLWAFIFGAFGNQFYLKMADRKIAKIISLELPEKETNEKIKKAGGTTLIPHLFIGVLLILVFYLANQGLINVG